MAHRSRPALLILVLLWRFIMTDAPTLMAILTQRFAAILARVSAMRNCIIKTANVASSAANQRTNNHGNF